MPFCRNCAEELSNQPGEHSLYDIDRKTETNQKESETISGTEDKDYVVLIHHQLVQLQL